MPKSGTITTGVDNLVQLVTQKKRLSVVEASKLLEVPRELIEEWVDFLEEKGVVKIEYKFTTPYLVLQTPTTKQAAKNKKAFTTKKEAFLRQIDSTMAYIESHSSALEKVKGEFDKINTDLDDRIKSIRSELSELERFDSLKKDLGSELVTQYEHFKKRMSGIEGKIRKHHKEYDSLTRELEDEYDGLNERLAKLEELRKLETKMRKNLELVKKTIKEVSDEEKKELAEIAKEEHKITSLKHQAKRIQNEIVTHRKEIKPLLTDFQKAEEKSAQAKEAVLAGLEQHLASVELKESRVESIKGSFEKYLKQKIDMDILLDKVTSEIAKLQAELKMIKQEARILAVTSTDKKAEAQVASLEKKFKSALNRKKTFEKEVGRLSKMIGTAEEKAAQQDSSDSKKAKPKKRSKK